MNKQALVSANPAGERGLATVFGRLRDEIDQLFDDFAMPGQMRRMFPLIDGDDFSPLVELKDKQDHYELALELPGIEEKDIDVQFADGVLTVSGEKRGEKKEKAGDCLISERSFGSFQRRVSMPPDVDPDSIEAKFRHGVLEIMIGKDKDAAQRVRKIAVN